ncbi:SDR family NAD(P)-dependent oxidoreductase [Capillimicrobium parvum]|uniref:3-oxoacyl-[acyl-carrier-protein] reductase FabG n=1 Tax=Capillimicrobium parvum TaxID=2884022 RepID=A0A9E6Y1V6_9ACTN|nr:SDR family NAD(P)-dependent oxidoreductase [Capillimicrobium parvum]UGS38426.1 3-oxoacyl-[acyl-carrier-protein] reductase FabG [Capillimicrobium parvum]
MSETDNMMAIANAPSTDGVALRSDDGLCGKTAFVTGSAQGLGAGVAQGLWDRGCNVVLADVNARSNEATAHAIDADGERVQALHVDVGDPASADESFRAALERWGTVDILVNNAAVTAARSLWQITMDEWDDVMSVNLRGVFIMSRIAGRHMRDSGGGRIVNIASLAGQMARPSGAHYAASKGGVIALTRVFASELAADGVTVNAVAPAIVDTPMLQAIGAERVQQLTRQVPVGRAGTTEEVAALVAFLASDDAGYITGATCDINGGMLMR